MAHTHLTLCLYRKDGKLLLGRKMRGSGAGKWNGFGGKVEKGERAEDAARREMREECGLLVQEMRKCGELDFSSEDGAPELRVHVYDVTRCYGDACATDEMHPEWFDAAALPLSEMWVADAHWLPLYLAGKAFRGKFVFKDQATIARHWLMELSPAEARAMV